MPRPLGVTLRPARGVGRLPPVVVSLLVLMIFNLLNRTNLDLPNRVFGNPNFGRVFSAKNPREMQVAVRMAF